MMPKLTLVAITTALFALVLSSTPAHADPNKASRYEVPASGAQVVPGPGDADGHADVTYTINRHGSLCMFVITTNISPGNVAVDLHRGVRGEVGEKVLQLRGPSSSPNAGVCLNIDRALAKDIARSRSDYYIDVHNDEFPEGALRAQLG